MKLRNLGHPVLLIVLIQGNFAFATPDIPSVPAGGYGIAECRSKKEAPGDGVALVVYEQYGKTKLLLRYETVMGVFQRIFEGIIKDNDATDLVFQSDANAELSVKKFSLSGILLIRQPRFKLTARSLGCRVLQDEGDFY